MANTLAYLLKTYPHERHDMMSDTSDQIAVEGNKGDLSTNLFPPTKRTRSAVWNFCSYEKDEQGNVIEDEISICKRCRQRMLCKGANTSNMAHYLWEEHPRTMPQ